MSLQVTFTNPFLKRVMFDTRINARVGRASQNLAECRAAQQPMSALSEETKQFVATSPFAEKLNKLRSTGIVSTKYNLDEIDYSTVDYKVIKRYVSSARLRVPLKVQQTISTVINNMSTEFIAAVRSVSKSTKLATQEALLSPVVQATTLGKIFETVPGYRDNSAIPASLAAPHEVREQINSTLQRAYRHAQDTHAIRGARIDDDLLSRITHSLYVVIGRLADALTHINNATSNKTVKNDIVRTMFEVYGLLTGCEFVGYFKPVVKLAKSGDADAVSPFDETIDALSPVLLPHAPPASPSLVALVEPPALADADVSSCANSAELAQDAADESLVAEPVAAAPEPKKRRGKK